MMTWLKLSALRLLAKPSRRQWQNRLVGRIIESLLGEEQVRTLTLKAVRMLCPLLANHGMYYQGDTQHCVSPW